MGAAVFQVNRYIDDEVGEDPARRAGDRAGVGHRHQLPDHRLRHPRRSSQSEADKEAFTDEDTTADGPARSDTMMVLHADGENSYAVSFPRDLWVNIPGHGQAEDQRRVQRRSADGHRHAEGRLRRRHQPLPRGELQDVRGHRERDRQRPRLLPVPGARPALGARPDASVAGCYQLDGPPRSRTCARATSSTTSTGKWRRRQPAGRHRPHRPPAGLHQEARARRGATARSTTR